MIYLTVRFILWVWSRLSSPWRRCPHTHHTERRWVAASGCPMVDFKCKDCGYHDRGHVHGDTEGWAGTTST